MRVHRRLAHYSLRAIVLQRTELRDGRQAEKRLLATAVEAQATRDEPAGCEDESPATYFLCLRHAKRHHPTAGYFGLVDLSDLSDASGADGGVQSLHESHAGNRGQMRQRFDDGLADGL